MPRSYYNFISVQMDIYVYESKAGVCTERNPISCAD